MRHVVFALWVVICASPAAAQNVSGGRIVTSSVGQAGQRQSSSSLGIGPLEHSSNRIQNRVQSRIRNRVDQYYDPQANAVSPFAVAGDQARIAGQPIRH